MLALCLYGTALAQTSSSYRLDEHTLNAGGHPAGGRTLASASYRVSLDSIGDGVTAPVLQSTSYSMDAGFARSYPAPGEVRGLVALVDKESFAWDPDGSVGSYLVYRGAAELLPGGYGACRSSDLPVETASFPEVPDIGSAYFYLVTARSRLREEGAKGHDSSGAPRGTPAPCP